MQQHEFSRNLKNTTPDSVDETGVWASGLPDVGTSGDGRPDVHADVGTFGRADVRTSGRPDVPTSGRLGVGRFERLNV